MKILLDTNIVLRLAQATHTMYDQVSSDRTATVG